MNNHLAPKYKRQFGDIFLTWFENSNAYIILDLRTNFLLESFFKSQNKEDYVGLLRDNGYSNEESTKVYSDVSAFLEDQNTTRPKSNFEEEEQKSDNQIRCDIYISYKIGEQHFRIGFASEKVKNLLHPLIEHLECKNDSDNLSNLYITNTNGQLFLYEEKELVFACKEKEYHKLQGRLSLTLLNKLYSLSESEYVASFHASTICKGKKSIMLIGSSGSGKSTLSALLMANGFGLVADDVSYMTKKDSSILSYPAAISLKKGSIAILEKYYPFLASQTDYLLDQKKGNIKYLPPSKDFKAKSYLCENIIIVNYTENSSTLLKEVSLKEVLQILIPESWVAPEPENAKKFFAWLENVKCYKLTYSRYKEAIAFISNLEL